MYPQVIQFQTRGRLFAEQLELLRARQAAAPTVIAKQRLARFAIRPAALLPRRHRATAGIS